MSTPQIRKIFKLNLKSPKEKFILLALESGRTNIQEISDFTCLSERTVKKYIKILIGRKYVNLFYDEIFKFQINYAEL
jgi:DNA-binding NarL/FixJ family response regulator